MQIKREAMLVSGLFPRGWPVRILLGGFVSFFLFRISRSFGGFSGELFFWQSTLDLEQSSQIT